MNRKHLLVLGLLSALPFIAYLFVPSLLGADSFYFYAFSCENSNIPAIDIPILSRMFFELMPCNLLAFKFLTFIILFLSTVIVAKTGELYSKEYGWLAGVFVFISIAWVHFHIQIEDDLLGFPFLFLANYFFLKSGIKKSKKLEVGIALTLLIFVGALLWKGALLYLVAYSFLSVLSLIILYASLFYIGFGSIKALLGNDLVQENMSAFLISFLGVRTIGFGQGFGLLGLYIFKRKVWLALPFLIAMLLNAKWAVHLSPFLGLGLMFMIEDIDRYRLRSGTIFKEAWANKHFVWVFVVMTIISTAALSVGLLFQNPNPAQMEAVEFAVAQSGGELLDNDWSYGYYIFYADGNTETFGGGWPRYTESFNDKILLSENPETYPCKVLRTWKGQGFYGNDITVYNCWEVK